MDDSRSEGRSVKKIMYLNKEVKTLFPNNRGEMSTLLPPSLPHLSSLERTSGGGSFPPSVIILGFDREGICGTRLGVCHASVVLVRFMYKLRLGYDSSTTYSPAIWRRVPLLFVSVNKSVPPFYLRRDWDSG